MRPARSALLRPGFFRPGLLALVLLGAAPAQARAEPREERCGVGAGSFAEVVEGSRGRGPVVSRPSSLCADIEPRGSTSVDVQVIVAPPGADAAAEGVRQGLRRR